MKTVIYARKSSESEDRQVQSIEDQLNSLRAFAKREGIRVDEEFTEAKSAKAPYTRPEFQRLTAEIQTGAITRVLTWSMNRLSRNHLDGGLIAHLLQTGVLESIRTPDRTYLPEDSALIMAIENGMSTSYIQDLTRNVRRGMEGKASRGWRPGRAPIGYINNLLTHEIEIDPERFPILRKAWELILSENCTLTEVQTAVVSMGLTRRNGRGGHEPLSRHTVFSMFSNPFYTGQFMFRGTLWAGKHQPLVTAAEFERVQSILDRDGERRIRTKELAFSGLMRCGNCGCQIVGDTRTKHYAGTGRTVTYVYYHCTNGRGGCSKQSWTEARIAAKFQAVFDRIKIPMSLQQWASEECLRQGEQELDGVAAGASTIDAQIKGKEKRLAKLHEMRLDEELSRDEYKEMKSRIEGELVALNKAASHVLSAEERLQLVITEKFKLAVKAESYAEKTTAEKRGMARGLGTTHYLTPENLDISVDPILQKIAAFKPLRNGSLSPKSGDLVGAGSVWSGLVHAIRTSARVSESAGVDQSSRLFAPKEGNRAEPLSTVTSHKQGESMSQFENGGNLNL